MKLKIIFLAAALATTLAGTGCVAVMVGGAVAAGAGTVAYIDGELKSSEAISLDRAHAATMQAVKDLQYGVVGDDVKDANTKIITVRTGGDKKVAITLERKSSTVTEIRIRVGVFGEQELSEQVMEKIKSHL